MAAYSTSASTHSRIGGLRRRRGGGRWWRRQHAVPGQGVRLEQQHGALLGQRRARLVEGQGKDRNPGLVELTALGLLNCVTEDGIGFVLQPIELLDRLHDARLL